MDPGEKSRYESLERIPQLDLLRTLAVTLVIISHWLPEDHLLNRYTPNGMLGVVIFFVLSGYLITRILLSLRKKTRAGLMPGRQAIKNFYLRRALRIVPLYFFVLLLVTILDVGTFRENWAWHWTYLSNIYFYLNPNDIPGHHLWSLSVEEQFYLAWPFIILFLPKRYLLSSILVIILIGPVFRYIFNELNPGLFVYRLTPSIFDSFGIGGLLAYAHFSFGIDKKSTRRLVNILFVAAVALCIVVAWTGSGGELYGKPGGVLFLNTLYSLISVWLISIFTKGRWQFTGWRSILRPLLYLGKISYSLYLFHFFLPEFVGNPFIEFPRNLLLNIAVLITLSTLTWYFLEKPVLSLKRYFAQ